MTRTPSKPLILVALLAASFVINLDTTLVNVALPALSRELGATTSQLQWVVDAYNLVFAALLLTFGSLSDRFGRKGMLLAGLAVVGAASLAGGFTTTAAPSPITARAAISWPAVVVNPPARLAVPTTASPASSMPLRPNRSDRLPKVSVSGHVYDIATGRVTTAVDARFPQPVGGGSRRLSRLPGDACHGAGPGLNVGRGRGRGLGRGLGVRL